jgi:hypothetical protein
MPASNLVSKHLSKFVSCEIVIKQHFVDKTKVSFTGIKAINLLVVALH